MKKLFTKKEILETLIGILLVDLPIVGMFVHWVLVGY